MSNQDDLAQPTLSVIMPVYNGRADLSEAVDSLLQQTVVPQQIIIIDDGSTDGTDRLIEEYCQRDPRIQLVRNAHGGVSAARNKGLELATGDFIYFMDADDLTGPTLFADFLREKRACPELEMFCFAAKMFMDVPVAERKPEITHARNLKGVYSGGTAFIEQLNGSGSAHRVLWSSIISRELIVRTKSRFLPIQNHEDAPFMFTLYLQAKQVFVTPEAYYFKRYTTTSLSVRTRDFSWVKNYFIAREGTEEAIRAANVPVERSLVDDYYFPVMSGCLKMLREHDMTVPKEYQPRVNALVRQLTRNNIKLMVIWYLNPLYSSLVYCKKKLSSAL
ncbi:heptose III glucuronosyltransferase [Erwinia persicina]|uniref:glycosyltransferase n=1 Tax=Erwinia TaxID=551 RepID=UPI0020A06535|nr:glycosyltransferase [Erwinia persicina]MCP1440668.1 heptose III glucuronosyltransferase [Erwinia persicina]